MNHKWVLSSSVAAVIIAGAGIAGACSDCGCSAKKAKASTECASGVCGVTDAAQLKNEGHTHAENLTTEQMKSAANSGQFIILDARGDTYFNGELIKGAQRMASSTDEAGILKALPNKDAEIITYCSNTKCPASGKLAAKLKSLGYTHVQEYPEGLAGWKEAGGKLDS